MAEDHRGICVEHLKALRFLVTIVQLTFKIGTNSGGLQTQ